MDKIQLSGVQTGLRAGFDMLVECSDLSAPLSFYKQFGPTVSTLPLADNFQKAVSHHLFACHALEKCFLAGGELFSVTHHFSHRHVTYALAEMAFNLPQAYRLGLGKSSFAFVHLDLYYHKAQCQI